MLTLNHYVFLSAILFCVGLYGAITRRNFIGILISLEIMLNAVNVNLVAFAKFGDVGNYSGVIFTVFTIALAAAEASVGLAIIIAFYRSRKTVNADDDVNLMRW